MRAHPTLPVRPSPNLHDRSHQLAAPRTGFPVLPPATTAGHYTGMAVAGAHGNASTPRQGSDLSATIDPVDAASRSRHRGAMATPLPARTRRGVGLSLTVHAAIVLCLMLTHSVQPLKEREDVTVAYQVVLLPAPPPPVAAEPVRLPATTPDLEQESPAPPPEVAPAQEPPTSVVRTPEASPEHAASQPEPPLQEREPTPPPTMAPTMAPAPAPRPPVRAASPKSARPPPHAVASKPPSVSTVPLAQAPPVKAAPPDPTWLASVSEWLMAHRFYPEMARRRGRQGTVVVRFDVDRLGHVSNANLVHDSGSPLLDQAALALIRDASLPPFPANMPSAEESVTVPIRYQLE